MSEGQWEAMAGNVSFPKKLATTLRPAFFLRLRTEQLGVRILETLQRLQRGCRVYRRLALAAKEMTSQPTNCHSYFSGQKQVPLPMTTCRFILLSPVTMNPQSHNIAIPPITAKMSQEMLLTEGEPDLDHKLSQEPDLAREQW